MINHQTTKRSFKSKLDLWEIEAEIIVKRSTKWKISHMPSLQDISDSEYMMVTKDENDHQRIIGVFYNKHNHTRTR